MITIGENDTALDWNYDGYKHDNLLSLLSMSTFEGRLKDSIEREINDTENMDKETYERIAFNLFSNQLDRITSGFSYGATDIIKHLRKLK